MAAISVSFDKGTQTLVVWFGDPAAAVVSDHTDSDVVIMEDKDGRPLGIEVLSYRPADDEPLEVALHVFDTSTARSGDSAAPWELRNATPVLSSRGEL